jgi:hypothetical protein
MADHIPEISAWRIWSPAARQKIARIVQAGMPSSELQQDFALVAAVLGQAGLRWLGIHATVVLGSAECLVGPNRRRDRVARGPRHAWLHTTRGDIVDFSVIWWRQHADPAVEWQIEPIVHWDSAHSFLSVSELGQARYAEVAQRPDRAPLQLSDWKGLVDLSLKDALPMIRELSKSFRRETWLAKHERRYHAMDRRLKEAERILSLQMMELEDQMHESRDPVEREWMGQELARLLDRRTEAQMGPRPPKLR